MGTKKQQAANAQALRHLKHTFVPHKDNRYKPHLIRPTGIAVSVVIVLAIQLVYSTATTGRPAVLGRTSNIAVTDLLNDTNTDRKAASLPALTLNDKLNEGAYLKAQDMLAKGYWGHNAPDGTQPWKWYGDVEYNYDYAGENLAKNYPSAQATVDAWMNSPTHRANVLDKNYTDVGFAVVEGNLGGQDTTLVVAFYGDQVPTVSAASVKGSSTGGITSSSATNAPATTGMGNPLTYFGSAVESLSPAVLAGLIILAVGVGVAFVAHAYRKKLPVAVQKSWRAHHALYSAAGFAAVAVIVIMMSGGGQI